MPGNIAYKLAVRVGNYKKEGDVLEIGEIIRINQPDVYKRLIKFSNNNNKSKVKKEGHIDFKRLMEDAPVYKRHNRALRQVRHGI